jgi:predicted O-methyltransferase YrrM
MERFKGTPEKMMEFAEQRMRGAKQAALKANEVAPWHKRQIEYWQAAWLYALARPYEANKGAQILEIGTAYGYTACVLAMACPRGHVVTLNPKTWERLAAQQALHAYRQIEFVEALSWDYLAAYRGPKLDFIFVDGDHKRVDKDFAWRKWLKPEGLMLFHDYSPEPSERACHVVFEKINTWLDGATPDIVLMATGNVGMVGVRG